eukprot:362306-Chlamydomonas_euryale.AAC.4
MPVPPPLAQPPPHPPGMAAMSWLISMLHSAHQHICTANAGLDHHDQQAGVDQHAAQCSLITPSSRREKKTSPHRRRD